MMQVYDVNGDGVMDAHESNDLKNAIFSYQKRVHFAPERIEGQ